MSHDPHLIDTIKVHFARKSSAQLERILQAKHQERWSPEAIAAAGEVLQDRRAGHAQEPDVAEEDLPEAPMSSDSYGLGDAALAAIGLFSGFAIIRVPRRVDYSAADPDLPVPFGPKMAWLALDTTDTEAVAAALSLRGARAASWADGIDAAHQSSVFVTPPVADWTLVLGNALFPPDRAEAFVKPLLERLSRQFGDAQFFCTHRDVELHVWARARQGQLVRGYGWLGQKGLTLWNEGTPTKEERNLNFRFLDERSISVKPVQNQNRTVPDEAGLMELACLWSIDPTTLDQQYKEPLMGLLGNLDWSTLV
jgi:hypothetical protein